MAATLLVTERPGSVEFPDMSALLKL